MSATPHPLDCLTPAEIELATATLRAAHELTDGSLVAHVILDEPHKDDLDRWSPGDPVERRVRVLVIPGPELTMVEYVIVATSIDGDEPRIESRTVIEGMRCGLTMTESLNAVVACHAHPDFVAALAKRGITDLSLVQTDPWPAGAFGFEVESGRRLARCISFLRETPEDNGYARPIEGLIVHVDMGRAEVLEVIDHGVVPLPPQHARYDIESHGPERPGLRPIEITQPDGPSFTVDGNLISWANWSLRWTFDPAEGLVLHQVAYADRAIAHRLSVSEMVVPYGDPGPRHGWKNAFDAGEWGLGRMTQSLELGCDCVGEITYLDAVMADEQGAPWIVEKAICLHEEDAGVAWKHVDLWTGRHETRRNRRLIISHVATVGNYEYGFYWWLSLDGMLGLDVKLTGILSPMATEVDEQPAFAGMVAPGVAAPHHQHLFCVRLDMDVDGRSNTVVEVDAEVMPPGPENPWGNAFRPARSVLVSELAARRSTDAARSRVWRIESTEARNALGAPTAYTLVPTMSSPTLLAHEDSPIGRRAGFARHALWVTPYTPDERRAAGEYPNQHAGGDGLPRWTAADRPLVDADVVLWYCFGVTHFPRAEDWPVMPVEVTGFLLRPTGFFDRNPALDLPAAGHCHMP